MHSANSSTPTQYYIGLMAGTSLDAVDAALIAIHESTISTLGSFAQSLPSSMRTELLALTRPGDNEIIRMSQMDNAVGELFAATALVLMEQCQLKPQAITAIGSHGQTIRHHPFPPSTFTVQIGNPNIIAQRTGITTVADFRRRDMAAGGQGAPLTPAFHNQVFRSSSHNRIIVNIGGIANVTILPALATAPVIGFDTGPGNCLLDSHIQLHFPEQRYDAHGLWATSGTVELNLLAKLLQEPYLLQTPPKSTGRELFHLDWLNAQLQTLNLHIEPKNIQATLLEYTAQTIVTAISPYLAPNTEILVCGGGCHNRQLMQRLSELALPATVKTTAAYGIDPDFVEAIAFAWMAHATMARIPSNLPAVTGAKETVILGGVYFA